MSSENVDRFVAATQVFNRLCETPEEVNLGVLRSYLRSLDTEVHFEPQQSALEGGYSGHEGVIQYLADLAEHYSGGHVELSEVRDLGDRVLAIGTLRIRGRASGIETEVPVAVLASFREGLITSFRDYGESDRALEAAGLSE